MTPHMGPFATNATDSSSGSPGIRELRSPTHLPSPADEVSVPRIDRALRLGPRMFGMGNEREWVSDAKVVSFAHTVTPSPIPLPYIGFPHTNARRISGSLYSSPPRHPAWSSQVPFMCLWHGQRPTLITHLLECTCNSIPPIRKTGSPSPLTSSSWP